MADRLLGEGSKLAMRPKMPWEGRNRARACKGSSYVYFIASRCNRFVKIGISNNPERRLLDIAAMSPVPVRLLGYLPGWRADEMALHSHYAERHSHGEWFNLSPSMLGEIEVMVRTSLYPSALDRQASARFRQALPDRKAAQTTTPKPLKQDYYKHTAQEP